MACNNGFSRKVGEKVVFTVRGLGGCDAFPNLRTLDCQGTVVSQFQIPETYRWVLEDNRIYEITIHRVPAGGTIEVAHQFESEPPVVDHCAGGPDPTGPWNTFVCQQQAASGSGATPAAKGRSTAANVRKALAIGVMGLGLMPALHATEPPSSTATSLSPPQDGETLKDYEDRLVGALSGKLINKQVAQKTTSTAAPQGFADRVHDSIADFLPIVQAGVDAVSTTSDDKKSVTVKVNPLRQVDLQYMELAISGTATQPQVAETLLSKIASPVRSDEEKKLLDSVGDYGDVTYTAELNVLTGKGNWTRRTLLGRTVRTYHDWISPQLKFATENLHPERFVGVHGLLNNPKLGANFMDATFKQAQEAGVDVPALIQVIQQEAQDRLAVAKASTIPQLAALIDNQPQLVVSVARRASNRVVGPRSTAYTLSYELGTKNVNAVLREYHRLEQSNPGVSDADRRLEALRTVVGNTTATTSFGAEDRLLISATYRDFDDLHFSHSYTLPIFDTTGTEIDLHPVATVDLGRSSELRGKVVWTRLTTGANKVAEASAAGTDDGTSSESPRLTVSIEGVRVHGDPSRHDQLVGKASYELPLSSGVTLPLTLTWANRPEFLDKKGQQFGAHVSLSYKAGSSTSSAGN